MAEIKTDCFGYNCRKNECTILTQTVCKHRNCSFYKTQEQYDEDREKYSAPMPLVAKHNRKCGTCGAKYPQSEMIRTVLSPNGWMCWSCHMNIEENGGDK